MAGRIKQKLDELKEFSTRWAELKLLGRKPGVIVPWRAAPPRKRATAWQLQQQRNSTRASRARRDRIQKLAEH